MVKLDVIEELNNKTIFEIKTKEEMKYRKQMCEYAIKNGVMLLLGNYQQNTNH